MSYGTCKKCGCTDITACSHAEHGSCWWVDETHELCSHCDDNFPDPEGVERFEKKEVDDSIDPEADKKYRKIGKWYAFIDIAKQQVFVVRDEPVCNGSGHIYGVSVYTEKEQVDNILVYSYEDITAEEFKCKYLEVLDKINYNIE